MGGRGPSSTKRPPSSLSMPDSTTIRVNSSTNSGTPSVRAMT